MSIVESVTSPVYATADGSAVNCMVKFDSLPSPVPFTASANDTEPHGRAIYAALLSGKYGPIKPKVR